MSKVVIIGAGSVGSSVAQMLGISGTVEEITLVDKRMSRSAAEVEDLIVPLSRMNPGLLIRCGTIEESSNADIVVICASAPARLGQSRNDMFIKNAQIVSSVVRDIERVGFSGLYLMVSNPVDLLTYFLTDQLGISPTRVVGSGTVLDTMRLEDCLRSCFISVTDVRALTVGEHGEGLIVDWSKVLVDGRFVPIEDRDRLRRKTIDVAYDIVKGKGSTCYGISHAVTRIVSSLLLRSDEILPLSVVAQGEFGITGIALSLPMRFNACGIPKIDERALSLEIVEELRALAAKMTNDYRLVSSGVDF